MEIALLSFNSKQPIIEVLSNVRGGNQLQKYFTMNGVEYHTLYRFTCKYDDVIEERTNRSSRGCGRYANEISEKTEQEGQYTFI